MTERRVYPRYDKNKSHGKFLDSLKAKLVIKELRCQIMDKEIEMLGERILSEESKW